MKTEKVVNEFDDQSVNRLLNNYQNKQINKKKMIKNDWSLTHQQLHEVIASWNPHSHDLDLR